MILISAIGMSQVSIMPVGLVCKGIVVQHGLGKV